MELLVVGFHRSGTSFVTQLLHSAGLFVGDELLGAEASNPYGHFEDKEVLRIHKEILKRNGVTWQLGRRVPLHIGDDLWDTMRDLVARRQAQHPVWGFKEPRSCLFLGAWKYLLPDAKALVVYRDPSDCVRSLHQRHARQLFEGKGRPEEHQAFFRSPDLALRMWQVHNRAVVDFVEANLAESLVVPYSRMTQDPDLVARINARFGTTLAEISPQSVYDPTAVGSRATDLVAQDPGLVRSVSRTWADLERLAALTGGI